MKRFSLCVCCAALFLSGCSSDLDLGKFQNKGAEVIYNAAKQEFDRKRYSDAVKIFDELERAHPYSKLVPQAQVLRGDCNYKMKKYGDAISEYEIFIRTHPTHEMVQYALYMLGKVHYEQMPIIQRDQENTLKAKEYLFALKNNFPSNKYQKSADEMIKVLNKQLAGKDIYIGKYYQKKKNYPASIERFNSVINNYGETDMAPEAFHRLIESYIAMELYEEAKKVYGVMAKKFPESSWIQHAQKIMSSFSPINPQPEKSKTQSKDRAKAQSKDRAKTQSKDRAKAQSKDRAKAQSKDRAKTQ
ncbi:MAG: outer membrane protein assembly factor BamD, partial [Holosporales bacterium]|nr:outer membrane protein assembly factor BamD [Holosporales bacterium]